MAQNSTGFLQLLVVFEELSLIAISVDVLLQSELASRISDSDSGHFVPLRGFVPRGKGDFEL